MILIGVVGAAVLLIISLWFSILAPTGASAATPVYVRPGGNDLLCNGTVNVDYSIPCAPNCAFRTISKGIKEVDTDGIVNVASGEYDESVVLDQVITVTMSGDITVTGNISITAGALNATPGVLALQGDFAHEKDGRFYSKNGTLKFNGSSPQHIQGDQVTSFANVAIDNSTGVYLDFN